MGNRGRFAAMPNLLLYSHAMKSKIVNTLRWIDAVASPFPVSMLAHILCMMVSAWTFSYHGDKLLSLIQQVLVFPFVEGVSVPIAVWHIAPRSKMKAVIAIVAVYAAVTLIMSILVWVQMEFKVLNFLRMIVLFCGYATGVRLSRRIATKL